MSYMGDQLSGRQKNKKKWRRVGGTGWYGVTDHTGQ